MTPLCEKCGLTCYVCPQCNVEFICSCDEPEHNCLCKEIKGVAGNPLGLYLKLLNLDGVDKVFDGNAHLDIEENGTPILKGWHTKKDGEERDENSFRYIDGYWMQMFPEVVDEEYNKMSQFEPEYETSLDDPYYEEYPQEYED